MRTKEAAIRWRRALSASLLAGIIVALAGTSQAATPKPPPPPKLPTASTGGVADVNYSSAVLDGVVNPQGTETSYYFQYGLTSAYGAQTPTVSAGNGTTGVQVSQPISGLQLGVIYHYRLVAVSSTGKAEGQDHAFTTKQIPLKFVTTKPAIDVFGSPFTVAGTLTGTGGANHQVILQADPFPYLGSFTDIGAPQTTNAEGGFSFHVPGLARNTQLRVRTLDPVPTYGQVLTEHVAVRVTLRAHSTGTPGMVRLEGTVSPAEPGAQVVFQWVRSAESLAKVGSAMVKRAAHGISKFSAVVPIRRAGHYQALVQVTGGRLVSGTSRTVFLRGAPLPVRRPHRAALRRHR